MSAEPVKGLLAIAALVAALIVWLRFPRVGRRIIAVAIAAIGLIGAVVAVGLAADLLSNSGMPSAPSPIVFLATALVMGLGGIAVAWWSIRSTIGQARKPRRKRDFALLWIGAGRRPSR